MLWGLDCPFPDSSGSHKWQQSLVKSSVLACAALHNMHLNDEESIPPRRRRYCPEGYVDHERPDGTLQKGRWRIGLEKQRHCSVNQ